MTSLKTMMYIYIYIYMALWIVFYFSFVLYYTQMINFLIEPYTNFNLAVKCCNFCISRQILLLPINAETVFRSRLSKAWAAATKLRSIFNSKANDSIKIGFCRSAVESILLYGLECLPLTLTLQDKLDSAYRRILRYALGVHFPVCISDAELARRTGATALSKTLRQRRLRLVGHALRMANPSPLTILLRFLQPGLRRRRGHA